MDTLVLAVLTVMAVGILLVREFAGVLSWRRNGTRNGTRNGKAPLPLNIATGIIIVAFAAAGIWRLLARA